MNKTTKYSRNGPNRAVNYFGRWCLDHGFDTRDIAVGLGCTPGQAWQYIVPLDHARFTVPRPAMMERIFAWTGGAIEPQRFYDVETWRKALNPKPAEKAA